MAANSVSKLRLWMKIAEGNLQHKKTSVELIIVYSVKYWSCKNKSRQANMFVDISIGVRVWPRDRLGLGLQFLMEIELPVGKARICLCFDH